MNAVFADSHYWIAVTKPNDPWSAAAGEAKRSLGNVITVTTDEMLTEFLTALCKSAGLRELAVKAVREIIKNPNVKVIPQSRDSFLRGLDRYEARIDKQYSLPDCISMNAMKDRSLTRILTNDHHFEQEGFEILMKRNPLSPRDSK
jgi:predicted nucleic acid-binding protein